MLRTMLTTGSPSHAIQRAVGMKTTFGFASRTRRRIAALDGHAASAGHETSGPIESPSEPAAAGGTMTSSRETLASPRRSGINVSRYFRYPPLSPPAVRLRTRIRTAQRLSSRRWPSVTSGERPRTRGAKARTSRARRVAAHSRGRALDRRATGRRRHGRTTAAEAPRASRASTFPNRLGARRREESKSLVCDGDPTTTVGRAWQDDEEGSFGRSTSRGGRPGRGRRPAR